MEHLQKSKIKHKGKLNKFQKIKFICDTLYQKLIKLKIKQINHSPEKEGRLPNGYYHKMK